jgi:hypothetical protein
MYGPIGFGHGAFAVLNAIAGVIGSVILVGLIVAVLFFLIRFLIVGTKAAQLYLDTHRRAADSAVPTPTPTPMPPSTGTPPSTATPTSTATVATVPTMPTVPTVVMPVTPPATTPATPVKPIAKQRTPRTPPAPQP